MKTKNLEKFNHLPQRQKKYAKTKTALLHALLKALETQKLSEIKIKSLVQKAEVSEPTFFNYFESKSDMLVYAIQMWSIEMNALAIACEKEATSYKVTIKNILRNTAEQIAAHPQIMREILSFQAQQNSCKVHEISDAEKWCFFPDIEGVEAIEGRGLESILPPLIEKMIAHNEIEPAIDPQLLFLMLASLFFGTSLLMLQKSPEHLPVSLEAQLDLLFEKITDAKS